MQDEEHITVQKLNERNHKEDDVSNTSPKIAWAAIRRWNEIDAEIRIALFRLVAILLLYSVHLVAYTNASADDDAAKAVAGNVDASDFYHQIVTLVAIVSGLISTTAIACVWARRFPTWLSSCFLVLDLACVACLILSRGQAGPVVMALIPIIFSAALRLRLEQVWVATILAGMVVALRWLAEIRGIMPLGPAASSDHALSIAMLVLSGILAGQIVRRTLALAKMIDSQVEGGQGNG